MNQDKKNTYNEWSNYETWTVHFFLTNEQGSYLLWKKRTWEMLGDQANAFDDVPSALARLADEIREAILKHCGTQPIALAADLMDAALSEVDWCEIAQEFIDDATPPQSERPGLFALGVVVATPGAFDQLNPVERLTALGRHSKGDWGDACPEDWAENELSLKEGFRLFSIYHSKAGVKFWIITEADRSATTILLPGEY